MSYNLLKSIKNIDVEQKSKNSSHRVGYWQPKIVQYLNGWWSLAMHSHHHTPGLREYCTESDSILLTKGFRTPATLSMVKLPHSCPATLRILESKSSSAEIPAWPTCHANFTIAAPVTWFVRLYRLGALSVQRTTTSSTRNHYIRTWVRHWACACQHRNQSDEDQSNSSLEEWRHDEWELVTCSISRVWVECEVKAVVGDM